MNDTTYTHNLEINLFFYLHKGISHVILGHITHHAHRTTITLYSIILEYHLERTLCLEIYPKMWGMPGNISKDVVYAWQYIQFWVEIKKSQNGQSITLILNQ